MLLRKFSIAAVASLMLLAPLSTVAQAADFSTGEVKQVHHFQKEYSDLSKKNYNIDNIYATTPNLEKKFKAGSLKETYIDSQLDYINYYRSLFGLPSIKATKTANDNAQKTAAVMASINANPFVNQHGLPSETKPAYISKSIWKLAQDTTETSNLNFNVNDQSAGDVVTDLLTDHYNLTGSDTGHRAWLLSTRLTTTGIGAAYGSNGYRYSVQKVLNVDDLFKDASQPVVAYPSTGLFPIELTKGKNISWSLYMSDKAFNKKPNIKITDMDTKTTYKATKATNYSNCGYGNFKTVITYSPGKTPLIAGHQYQVKVNGLYKYTFKLFRQDVAAQKDQVAVKAQTYQKVLPQKETNTKSAFLKQSAKLWATLIPKNKTTKKEFYYFDSLKKGNWDHNFFVHHFLKVTNN